MSLWFYKIDGRPNNPEKSLTTKIGEHIPCGYSMPTIWAFDTLEKKPSLYCGWDSMKNSYSSFREYVTDVINFEKKKVIPLIK